MKIKMTVRDNQELFTHRDGNNGRERTFLVGTMQDFVAKYPGCDQIVPSLVDITADTVYYIRSHMGIEQERIDRLAEPWLSMPGLAIIWPQNGEVTMVDGNHRAVRLFESGVFKIQCYAFKWPF